LTLMADSHASRLGRNDRQPHPSRRALQRCDACQKLTDPKWKAAYSVQIRTVPIRTGTLTDSIGRVVAGVKGVLGTDTYLGSVGLAIANGIDSRRVGIAAGIGWIVLGVTPSAA
jgi:hypothetical protein